MRARGLGLLLFPLMSCANRDSLPTSTEPEPQPAMLTIISGNNQEGSVGQYLARPLVVRVTDATGNAVPGVRVFWLVTSGEGEFGLLAIPNQLPPTTHTDIDGMTRVLFRPMVPGESSVAANTASVAVSPATFSSTSSGGAAVVIRFGPMFDCTGGNDPSRFSEIPGSVPAGTLVAWEYADWLDPSCAARVVSRSVPPGAPDFDSGILPAGQRFEMVLGVAGVWVFEDVINGGSGTLVVR